ncbi:MAG: flagellar protein FliS [Pseudomonadota bacterium]|nr:flagellar protein FliS [Pseudomonadota bacterium]
MNIALARSRYKQAAAIGEPEIHDPHEVIHVTLRELERSLGVMEQLQKAERATSGDHANRSLTAIYILQSSLDFEKGGDLATNLFQVYEYVRFHVLKAWRNEGDAELGQARLAIGEILSAWQTIGDQVGERSE